MIFFLFLLDQVPLAVGNVPDYRSWGHKFESKLGNTTSMESNHEITSLVILPLQLILERQFSFTGKIMYTKYLLPAERTKPAQEKWIG